MPRLSPCFALCLSFLTLILSACGGSGGTGSSSSGVGYSSAGGDTCSVAQQKSWTHDFMAFEYYWNAQVQTQLGNSALQATSSSVSNYFNALLWAPALGGKDRYSFIMSSDEYTQAAAGEEVGFGVDWGWYASGGVSRLRAHYVESGSPAALAGVQRGDTLQSVNGAAFVAGSYTQTQWDALFPSRSGVSTSLSLTTVTGSARNAVLTATAVNENPVLLSKIMTGADGKPVAYVVFNSFMSTKGLDQLVAAFRQFKQAGIQDLILDLRYNGGGLLDIASKLAGLIAGDAVSDKVFYRLVHNSNRSGWNQAMYFNTTTAADATLGLKRVFVLTDHGTASASEAVINGLKPFVSVIQIGQTSYGKPTGMYGTPNCGNYYFAINFEGFNAKGEGGYYDGLAPTCAVADDLVHALGDGQEAMLAGALAYRISGQCPALAAGRMSADVADRALPPLFRNPLKHNLIVPR